METGQLQAAFATMIVCVCRRVSDHDIHRAARDGVASFDQLQAECGVGTVCGSCVDCARDTWVDACQRVGSHSGAAQRPFDIRAVPA